MCVELANMGHSSMGKQVYMIVAAVVAGQLSVSAATCRATCRGLSFWVG